MFAAHHQLDNLVLIVDSNKKSMLGYCGSILNLSPLEEKFAAFGWDVATVDGHDVRAVHEQLSRFKAARQGAVQGVRGRHGQGQGRAASRTRRPLSCQNPERTRGPGGHGGSGMIAGRNLKKHAGRLPGADPCRHEEP